MTTLRTLLRVLPMLALVLAALACAAPANAAAPTARVDRTTLSVGESFDLVITLVGGDGTQPPDLSPLARDFDILDRNRASRVEVVNGRRTQINEWILTLASKRPGAITVPGLTLAGQTTAPIRLSVDAASPVDPAEARPLFVQVEPMGPAPYVQGEMLVAVRIYTNGPMLGGGLTPPEAVGATFTKVGDQRMFSKVVGRQRYRVVEQGYIMRPQRSGTIEIGPVTLVAQFASFAGGRLPSDMARLLGRNSSVPMAGPDPSFGREVTVTSDPVRIEVKARPAAATGWFLPSQGVTLSSTWDPPLAQAKAGETLTRTITLEAVGATPNQLPPMPIVEADGVRQYEESSRSDQALINGKPGAVLIKTISVVPTREGTITLPGLDVGWWNTDTNTQETAHLPAETFTVAASDQARPAAPQPQTQPAPIAVPQAPPPAVETQLSLPAWLADMLNLRTGATLAAILLVLGVTALLLRRRTGHVARAAPARRPAYRSGGAPRANTAAALADLRAACKADDAVAAHAALLAWTRADGSPASAPAGEPDPQALDAQTFRTPAMAKAAEDLRQHLYGAGSARWSGAACLSAVNAECAARARSTRKRRGARLAPLYPQAG
ncbi:BatD family protein [Roseixanthobacter glucoisosaccharinicivorans]|uniref:BatD family protein n=1 Tax=Roseixanthobacter glucoisosaccharinicivorans TaxID=3119923 RepID=UPI003729BEA7